MQSLPAVNASAYLAQEEQEAISLFRNLVLRVNRLYKSTGAKEILLEDAHFDPRKDALAYFVHAQKLQEPQWKDHIRLFIKDEDEKTILERLSKSLDQLYLTHLHKKANSERAVRYQQIITLNTLLQQQGKLPQLGGIPRDELPQWYLTNFKQPS